MESINGNPEVCFFDSGIGGINLLYECVRRLPRVNFTYFADNYRMPYGSLGQKEMLELVEEKFDEMKKMNPAAAVIACNTVTAQCAGQLRAEYGFAIVGIQPAVKPAAEKGSCIVLATPATARSKSFETLVEKYGNERTQTMPCENLAAYIEENVFSLSADEVKSFLPSVEADGIVLGCTHYIFAKDIISDFYNCPVYDGIEGTADHLCKILGIFDHRAPRAQKIRFSGGDMVKNRRLFNLLAVKNGGFSQNLINQDQKN